MRKLFQSLPVLLIIAFFSGGCGTTLIKDQSAGDLSAVTMYMSVNNFVIEGVSIKNLDTGDIHYNKRYGWGKEFFPRERRYSYVSIGNLKAGYYSLVSVTIWYFPPGEKKKKNVVLDIPDYIFRFRIHENDILYLGDINLTVLNETYDEQVLNKYIDQLRNNKFTVRKFKTMVQYRGTISDVLYVNGIEPAVSQGLRPAEEFFLKFFISEKKNIPGWAGIAQKKLTDTSNYDRQLLIDEIESR